MQKIAVLLVIAVFTFSTPSLSQKKLTLSGFVGTGASFFGGPGAVSKSTYYRSPVPFPNFTDTDTMAAPYGNKSYLNFLAGVNADIKFFSKWILRLSAQYEHTGGRLDADSITTPPVKYKTTGTYLRQYDNIAVNPQIGRVFLSRKDLSFILFTGVDYTSKLEMGNRCDFKDQNGQKTSIGYSGGEPEVNDFRITGGVSLTAKRWGVDINYKHGLTNYNKYGADKVFSRIFQLRLQIAFLDKTI